MLQAIHADRTWPLHDAAATRAMEQALLARLPPHAAMARAGAAVARLARALVPHARHIWIACGPGNNGGDGWVTACELMPWAQASGARLSISHSGDPARLPADARWAFERAQALGLHATDGPPPDVDLAIDAIWGLGARTAPSTNTSSRPTTGPLWDWLHWLADAPCPVLCVDLPSGLNADTGQPHPGLAHARWRGPRHTLSLLSLKPGLFTALGRDAAGQVWLDDLQAPDEPPLPSPPPTAWWGAPPAPLAQPAAPAHSAHKGTRGDVVVVGGQGMGLNGAGMTGAGALAARAALQGGAGRVYWVPLDDRAAGNTAALGWDPQAPELMLRSPERLTPELMRQATVVCGCGGGDAVGAVLSDVLAHSTRLVLDADGLNHVAATATLRVALMARANQGLATVITPHPLEAARLLGTPTAAVQAHRLQAAQTLADTLQVVCVLKGSGSVVAAPGLTPFVNGSGNGWLATAGTGDVLAGLIGAALGMAPAADSQAVWAATCQAVHAHGRCADGWRPAQDGSLTASGLVARLPCLATGL